MTMTMTARRCIASLLLTMLAIPAVAQTTALPDWDALTPTQREKLIGPLRERWNEADADERQRLWQRAQRWQALPAEQRRAAQRGMGRFERMDPQQQAQMRALFERTRSMPPMQRRHAMALFHAMRRMTPAQREELKQHWIAMTPTQRQQWLDAHAPHRREGQRRHGQGMRDE